MLAGCATSGANKGGKGAAEAGRQMGRNIPDPPPKLRETCARPTIGDSESPWSALGRTGSQLIECEGKRAGLDAHSATVKQEFSAR